MSYELTQHARDVLDERQIPAAWMERALNSPVLVEASATDGTLESRFVRIAEHGGRVLRVVVNKSVVPPRVVSVYFDRTMKDRL
jgi:hypothetical protein